MKMRHGSLWIQTVDIDMKKCYKCGETKTLDCFGKNKHKKDGFSDECKGCKSLQDAAYREKNEERIKAQKNKAYHDARAVHGRLPWAEWAAVRKEQAVGDQILKNIHNHKRRTLMRKTKLTELDDLIFIEAYDLAKRREELTGTKWHVDHIVPIYHKEACGLNNGFNLQVVPATWNVRKNNKSMATYWPTSTG